MTDILYLAFNLVKEIVSLKQWSYVIKLVENKLISKTKGKNRTTKVPEKYEINVKMRRTTNI